MDPLESSELYHILADSVGLGSTDEMDLSSLQPARARPIAPANADANAQTEAEAKVRKRWL